MPVIRLASSLFPLFFLFLLLLTPSVELVCLFPIMYSKLRCIVTNPLALGATFSCRASRVFQGFQGGIYR